MTFMPLRMVLLVCTVLLDDGREKGADVTGDGTGRSGSLSENFIPENPKDLR
jgi:hypothetical protein